VQQFLEFAGKSHEAGPPVAVDAFIRKQFCNLEEDAALPGSSSEAQLFRLELRAGPEFALPRMVLDRLMTNLVDNALEHGAPPVDIATYCEGEGEERHWIIDVRDRGPGIPDDRMAAAMKPFVRLDPARGSAGHCGLGLAIVERLARENGGRCELANDTDGGLRVRITLPMVLPMALPMKGREEVRADGHGHAATNPRSRAKRSNRLTVAHEEAARRTGISAGS
jgi:two-component system osmolarity sensor histidine kinase EnvZ